ncbi:MAG: hypothetical protein AYK19_14760 [Theionarchaea archaeon DG-70-1]|nr:MAG: hypothetical protein AYK19_14760 [Theionarchaea archaeon DG-70-1]
MKTLVVRPGSEIVEKTLRGPWPLELAHLERLYTEPGEFCRAFVQHATIAHSSSLAVGTVLKNRGEHVEYLDIPLEFGIPLREESKKKRREKIKEYIAQGKYDVVGISCTTTCEGVATQGVAEAAKQLDVPVVVGGYQAASAAYDMMEKIPSIDVIMLSDFELVVEKLYQFLDGEIPVSAVPNIVYRENGRIRGSERIHMKIHSEDLPKYDYSLVENYIPNYSLFVVEASRGCPYDCSFCQEKVVRQLYTVKDAAVVVEETIDTANYLAHFKDSVSLLYSDALWGAHPQWVKDFCLQLAERKDEITSGFGWIIESRIGWFDEETLSLMKKAGCMSIAYGVESLSPKMLAIMNKTKDPRKYITSVFDTVEKTLTQGIHTGLLFLLGMPGETHSTVEETIHLMKKLPLDSKILHYRISLPAVLPGTLLDKQVHDPEVVEEYGLTLLGENDWEKAYFPRHTLLFNPSRELSAAEMTDIYLDIVSGACGIPVSLEKKLEVFEEVRTILDNDEISPAHVTELGRFLDFSRGWPDIPES